MPTDPYGRPVPPWSSMFYGQQGNRMAPADQMRVSDAERQEVADALAKHFGDGRLDRSELDERVHRAMTAKVRADFAGLLDDLPRPGPAGGPVPPPRPRRPRFFVLATIAIVALIVGASFSAPWWHVPWFLIFILVFLVMRGRRRWWYHHHHHHHAGGVDIV